MSASNGWAKPAPLGELLIKNDQMTAIEADLAYREVTIKLWGKGVVERRTTTGSEIAAARRSVVKAGDFILSRIDARNGAMGIIPQELDGAVVSNDFPSFATVRDRLLPEYLGWLSKTRGFVDACRRASEGTTNRVRLKEEKFLNQTIPLPPLSEQRQIVAKIERLAGKIVEARELQQSTQSKRLAMLQAVFRRLIDGALELPMGEVAPLVRRPVEVSAARSYLELGVRCFGKGTFHKPAIEGMNVGTKKLYHIEPGDLVFSNVFAWEGAIAVASDKDDGRVGSHRFITCVPDANRATSSFLQFYFTTPRGLYKIGEASPGGAGRNRTLGLKRLEAITVPLPSLEQQLWFDNLQDEVADADQTQDKAVAKLDAILPSVLDRAFRGELGIDLTKTTTRPSTTDDQLAKRAMVYTVMLLRHWNQPVARNAFDACLALMLNDQARKKILGDGSYRASTAAGSCSPLRGLDSLLGEMRVRKAVRISTRSGQQFLELGQQPPSTDNAPAADKTRLQETLAAFEIVGEDRTADVLAEMFDATYELTAT